MALTTWDEPLRPLTPEDSEPLDDQSATPISGAEAFRETATPISLAEAFREGGESRSVTFRQGPPSTASTAKTSREFTGGEDWHEVDQRLERFSRLVQEQQKSLLSLQLLVKDKAKGEPRRQGLQARQVPGESGLAKIKAHFRSRDHPSHMSQHSATSGFSHHSNWTTMSNWTTPSSYSEAVRKNLYVGEVLKGLLGQTKRLSLGVLGRKDRDKDKEKEKHAERQRNRQNEQTNGRYSRRTLDIGLYGNVWSQRYSEHSIQIPSFREGIFPWIRALCRRLLAWQLFEPLIITIIALNAVNIGWTIDLELRGRSNETGPNESLELVFLVIFFAEMTIRILAKGCRSLLVPANTLDFLLVVMTTLSELINYLPRQSDDNFANLLRRAGVLRMMRLLRLSRAVRLVASLKSLWKLVQGLIHGIGTMVSALMLLFLTIYIFACFGAEFISKEFKDEEGKIGKLIDKHFSTLPQILLTLFQFITMDSTAAIYVPLINHSPLLAIYFVLLLVVVTIALMNLITAILVEDAICTAQMDDEMKAVYTRRKLKQLTPALHDLFHRLDKTGDGLIQIKEVVEVIKDGLEIPVQLQDFLNPARMVDLFDALDSDNNGELTEKEFVEGLTSVALTDVQIETIEILHLLRSLRREIGRGLFLPPATGSRICSPLDGTSESIGQNSHFLADRDLGAPASQWRSWPPSN